MGSSLDGSADGDPGSHRRQGEAESQDQVRKRREALRVRIQKKQHQSDGRKQQRQPIQARSGRKKQHHRERGERRARSVTESAPEGRAREAVRGFSASSRRSASRLCAIAALRAPSIASRIFPSVASRGHPSAARNADSRAKGSAKSVWENLIISSVVRRDRRTPGRALIFCDGARATPRAGGSVPAPAPFQRNCSPRGRKPEHPRHADAVGIEKSIHRRRVDVERGGGRGDDRSGQGDAPHVLDVDERVRGLPKRQDQRPPLLEAHVCGALEQIASDAVGDRAERASAARDDDHRRGGIGPGRDRGAHVGVRVERDSSRDGPRRLQPGEPFLRRGNGGSDLAAGYLEGRVGDDEVKTREALGAKSDLDEAARQSRSRPARDADDDFPARHGPGVYTGQSTGIWTAAKTP